MLGAAASTTTPTTRGASTSLRAARACLPLVTRCSRGSASSLPRPPSTRAASSTRGGSGAMAGLFNSLKSALGGGGVGGPGGDGNSAPPSAAAFADAAPSWAELEALVATTRQRLGVPEPDLENVSGGREKRSARARRVCSQCASLRSTLILNLLSTLSFPGPHQPARPPAHLRLLGPPSRHPLPRPCRLVPVLRQSLAAVGG